MPIGRWASTSAITWGCSLDTYDTICSGRRLRRYWKGCVADAVMICSRIASAALPWLRRSNSRARSNPPATA
jgi:hypothetical protein